MDGIGNHIHYNNHNHNNNYKHNRHQLQQKVQRYNRTDKDESKDIPRRVITTICREVCLQVQAVRM